MSGAIASTDLLPSDSRPSDCGKDEGSLRSLAETSRWSITIQASQSLTQTAFATHIPMYRTSNTPVTATHGPAATNPKRAEIRNETAGKSVLRGTGTSDREGEIPIGSDFSGPLTFDNNSRNEEQAAIMI